MKKTIGITLAIMIVANLLAGCGERMEEDKAEKVQTSKMETDQENGLMPGNDIDKVEESTTEAIAGEEQESVPDSQGKKESNLYQEESRVEPTEEHDKQMLALLDEACGSQIYVYVSVDMDKDGEH